MASDSDSDGINSDFDGIGGSDVRQGRLSLEDAFRLMEKRAIQRDRHEKHGATDGIRLLLPQQTYQLWPEEAAEFPDSSPVGVETPRASTQAQWADRNFVLQQIRSKGPHVLARAADELKRDREVVLLESRPVLEYASEELRADREFLLKVMKEKVVVLAYASEELRADREFVLEAVRRSGMALQHASEELKAHREVVLEAVKRNGCALQYASKELRADSEVVLEAVRQHGLALEHASKELRAAREVVLEAVRQNVLALEHASKELRAAREVVLQAVRQNGSLLADVSMELRADRQVVLGAVRQNGLALRYASMELRADWKVVLEAAKQDATAFQHVAPELRAQRQLVLQACRAHAGTSKVLNVLWSQPSSIANEADRRKWRRELSEDHSFIADAIYTCPHEAADLLRLGGFEDTERHYTFEVAFMLSGSRGCVVIAEQGSLLRDVMQQALQKLQVQDARPEDFQLVLADVAVTIMVRVKRLANATDEDRSSREVVLQFVHMDGLDLQWADAALQDDEDVVLAAVQQNAGAFHFASRGLKMNEGFVSRLIEQVTQVHEEIARTVLGEDPSALLWQCLQQFQDSEDVVLAAVQRDFNLFAHASERLRDDEAVVLAAIQLDFRAFDSASERLRNDMHFLEQLLLDVPAITQSEEDGYQRGIHDMAIEIDDIDLRNWWLSHAHDGRGLGPL